MIRRRYPTLQPPPPPDNITYEQAIKIWLEIEEEKREKRRLRRKRVRRETGGQGEDTGGGSP